jgi:hypothetical protein
VCGFLVFFPAFFLLLSLPRTKRATLRFVAVTVFHTSPMDPSPPHTRFEFCSDQLGHFGRSSTGLGYYDMDVDRVSIPFVCFAMPHIKVISYVIFLPLHGGRLGWRDFFAAIFATSRPSCKIAFLMNFLLRAATILAQRTPTNTLRRMRMFRERYNDT